VSIYSDDDCSEVVNMIYKRLQSSHVFLLCHRRVLEKQTHCHGNML